MKAVLRRLGSLWMVYSSVVALQIKGEAAHSARNRSPEAGVPCSACGKPWDQHFGKGPCPWWQGASTNERGL